MYTFEINGAKANLISSNDYDKVVTSETYPAREYHENTHAVLSYTEELGVHWEYIPFTPAELREQAYRTEKLIAWGQDAITVDEANDMWLKYDAEGNDKAALLTDLIAAAKADIRERYPDEVA